MVIMITMFINNPVIFVLSIAGAVSFFIIQSKNHFFKELLLYMALFIAITIANPLFTHNGRTILFFLNGMAITYEAIIYGVFIAIMMIAVLYWFKCFTKIMTSDKMLYLFGRAIPKLSVILSMVIRFLPLFRKQIIKVSKSQTAMGLYSNGNYIDNTKGAMRVFSIMVTWSLENAIETADSMRARGYGFKGRTQFSIFRFRLQDALLLIISILLAAFTMTGIISGATDYSYYPVLSDISISIKAFVAYIAYGILAFIPFIIEAKENIKWTFYKSKI